MQKYQDKPIPLIIQQQNQKYSTNPQAILLFNSLSGKIAIVSVAGIYRTGKSFLLNTILLNHHNGFAVGPTTNPKTKGLWVWGKPLTLKNQNDQIVNVLIIDSEGLGSMDQDINHDLRLFSLTVLLSSCFLYNTLGAIDQNAIDSLGLVLRLCEHLKAVSYNDFPDFYWVLRDFSLSLVDKDNCALSPKKYLQNCLNPQSGDSQDRNRIRSAIRSAFVNRNCFAFVRPLTDQGCLQNLNQMQLDDLRPEFVEQVLDFRKNLFADIKTKTIRGKAIGGDMLCDLVNLYISEINEHKLPVIETGWKYVCRKQCQNVMDELQAEMEKRIQQAYNNMPTTKKSLKDLHHRLINDIKLEFNSRTLNNDQSGEYLAQLIKNVDKKVRKMEEDMKVRNINETKNFLKRQFQPIQKRLKQQEFKSMLQLVREFEVFYQFYRKKCPYKDEVAFGAEYLLKKFSESSLMVSKTVQAKKDLQIEKAKGQNDQLLADSNRKEEKLKQQKAMLHEKVAVLQSKIQEISAYNHQMTQTISLLQNALQKNKQQTQDILTTKFEEIELQNLNLKKKLMNNQETLSELECSKNQQVNNMKKQLILQQNQITNLREEKDMLQKRYVQLKQELQMEKEEKPKLIQQLSNNIKRIKIQYDNEKSILKQNSNQRTKILQNEIEMKTQELQILKQKCWEHNEMGVKINEANMELEKCEEKIRVLETQLKQKEEKMASKIREIEEFHAQKELTMKAERMAVEKQKAMLLQQIQFIKGDSRSKQDKIQRLLKQNQAFGEIFQEKDTEIEELLSQLEELRNISGNNSTEFTEKYAEMEELLSEKQKEVTAMEAENQKLLVQSRQCDQKLRQKENEIQGYRLRAEETVKQLTQKLNNEIKNSENIGKQYEKEIQLMKVQNNNSLQEQKRSAEISLVQLKNYYEMQKQRLQKRILEQRKRYEDTEQMNIKQLQNKQRKQIKQNQQQIILLQQNIDNLQQQLRRLSNQYQCKISTIKQDSVNEIKGYISKIQQLQKRYQQVQSQFTTYQSNQESERIGLVKKIQSLNFQVVRKDKDYLQLMNKKEGLEQSIAKKDNQIEAVKKIMNQEIQASLKKVSEVQNKYHKLNEEFMEMRIQLQKEIALSNQKNEFLTSKLSQMSKQKQMGVAKSIQKIDKQKILQLREQNEKYKNEVYSLQKNIESIKATLRENQSSSRKLQIKLQKQNQFLKQKNILLENKLQEFQNTHLHRNQVYNRETQQTKNKYQEERMEMKNEIQILRDQLTMSQEQRNQLHWKTQKEVQLMTEKLKYAEYQREQFRKELEENQKRFQITVNQLKKNNDKGHDDTASRKSHYDHKMTTQMELLKDTMKNKNEQLDDTVKKQKEQIRSLKEKNIELADQLHRADRAKSREQNLQEENETLRRQKDSIIMNARNERMRESEESKKKMNELEKRFKESERKNHEYMFILEKEQSKWAMERANLVQKIKNLQEAYEFQKNKIQVSKIKAENRRTTSYDKR